MGENLRRFLTAVACVVMGCAVGVVVTYCATTGALQSQDLETDAGLEKYAEIMDLVDYYFIEDDVDMTAVNDAMASGIISGLGDRWSYYVSAEDYQAYVENINNAYVGVGITILAQYDEAGNLTGYEITEVTAGGPAEEAGVLAGDILVRVGDTQAADVFPGGTEKPGQRGRGYHGGSDVSAGWAGVDLDCGTAVCDGDPGRRETAGRRYWLYYH